MKTKVKVSGVLLTNRKDIRKIFKAIEQTGLDVNYSKLARKLNMSVSTVYDAIKKFEERNDIELIFCVKGYEVK
jgi:DNA-binding MarR family transcriptional regulator